MDEANEMDLSEIFYVIAKRKMMIISITLVCTLIAAVVSFFIISPTYQSETSVIVDKKGNSAANQNVQYNDVMMYQNLVKTYASIGQSDDVYIKAAQKLNTGISSDKLAKSITITPVANTQLLTIDAVGGSPQEALNSVTAVTDSFIQVANNVYPAGDIRIVNKGKLPKTPSKPNKKLNIAIGFFLGLMISAGTVFMLDYLDNTVESVEDIKRNFDLPILGTIQIEQEN